MNMAIAILGLALLVLVHEAGHFFTARAVGMKPRRFYVGFPPALVKVERNGIEYGLGAIPLGGYVKIPGMHRPAPSDLDTYFGRALAEAPRLSAPLEHVRRPLADGDFERTRAVLPEIETALESEEISPAAQKAAQRGLVELRDALGRDAYWRQRTWKRIAVIFAGPATNVVFAVLLFALLFTLGGGSYRLGFALRGDVAPTRTVDTVLRGSPAEQMGLRPGDR
ncbi:MAG: site-2 protease family protein, partial [Actinomycetota bacterium]|nr:site-2 protease family protein [Actinomycetota bacterium]